MILQIEGLELYYGDAQALDGISLGAEEGELVAIVGANGAGKSSLIRTIAGIESAARGPHPLSRRATSPGCPAIASAIWASARWPRGGRSSPRSPWRRTCEIGACCRVRVAPWPTPCARCSPCSRAWRAARPGGRHHVGRRAADAGDRPLPDGQAGADHVRRALAGPGAGNGAGAVPHHSRTQRERIDGAAGGAERGRLSQARKAAPTCWRTAASSWPAPAPSCSPTTACAKPISASTRHPARRPDGRPLGQACADEAAWP